MNPRLVILWITIGAAGAIVGGSISRLFCDWLEARFKLFLRRRRRRRRVRKFVRRLQPRVAYRELP